MEIRNFPLAQALYLKYCRLHNKDMLKDVYIQEDDHKSQAECHIRESFDPKVTFFKIYFPSYKIILFLSN